MSKPSYLTPLNMISTPIRPSGLPVHHTYSVQQRPWAIPTLPHKNPLLIIDSNGKRLDPLHPLKFTTLTFSGGKYEYLTPTIRSLPCYPDIPSVLTCLGINSRGQNFQATSKKYLLNYVSALRRTVPGAKLYFIPIMCQPANPNITSQNTTNVETLNNYIIQHYNILQHPAYLQLKFERDGIHTTRDTINALASYWESFLCQQQPQ